MYELKADNFQFVKKLFANIEHSIPIVYSVLEGNANGRVYVDNLTSPKTALLYPINCYFYIIGEQSNDEFNGKLVDHIFNEILPNSDNKEIIIFSFNNEWDYKLTQLFADFNSIKIKRFVYKFNLELFNTYKLNIPELSGEFNLDKIDVSNIYNINVLQSWASKEQFLKQGLGYCITKGNDVIATCYSVYAGNNNYEIDIATKEEFRGRGIATILAKAFIEECIKHNKKPNWSCWPEKKASIKIAKKLGFDCERALPVQFWVPELNK